MFNSERLGVWRDEPGEDESVLLHRKDCSFTFIVVLQTNTDTSCGEHINLTTLKSFIYLFFNFLCC